LSNGLAAVYHNLLPAFSILCHGDELLVVDLFKGVADQAFDVFMIEDFLSAKDLCNMFGFIQNIHLKWFIYIEKQEQLNTVDQNHTYLSGSFWSRFPSSSTSFHFHPCAVGVLRMLTVVGRL